jgi:nitroreductase
VSLTDTTQSALIDAALLQARYGADAVPAAGKLNEVLRCLLAHRTVRAYLPDALPPGTLETLVAAAQSAASSSNLQLWSVIAVEDAGRKARREAGELGISPKQMSRLRAQEDVFTLDRPIDAAANTRGRRQQGQPCPQPASNSIAMRATGHRRARQSPR